MVGKNAYNLEHLQTPHLAKLVNFVRFSWKYAVVYSNFYTMCRFTLTLKVYDLTFISGGGGDSSGVTVENAAKLGAAD